MTPFAVAAAVAACCAIAFLVEGALGFGATVVALTLGAFVVSPTGLLPALLPFNMALSAAVVLKDHARIDRALLFFRVLPLMLLGAPLGFLFLMDLDAGLARRVFGAVVILLAAFSLLRRSGVGGAVAWGLFIAGGAVHGAFGTGGPLVVAGITNLEKRAFRATLSALWLILNLLLLVAFTVTHRFTSDAVALMPACGAGAVVGGACGFWLHDRINGPFFSRLVWVALAVTGAVLVLRS